MESLFLIVFLGWAVPVAGSVKVINQAEALVERLGSYKSWNLVLTLLPLSSIRSSIEKPSGKSLRRSNNASPATTFRLRLMPWFTASWIWRRLHS